MRKLRIDSVGLRGDDPRWPKLLEDDIYDLLTLTPIRVADLLAILARVKRRVSVLPVLTERSWSRPRRRSARHWAISTGASARITSVPSWMAERKQRTYRDFRRTVQPMFCGDGAIVVPWAGMMLAIEPNGYAHT